MTDEELLRGLDAAIRRRAGSTEPVTESLQRFANGDATAATNDEVAADLKIDRTAREELTRPLGEDFQRAALSRVLAERAAGARAASSDASPTSPSAMKLRRGWNVAAGASVILALAASVVFWLSPKEPKDGLPVYSLSASGGESDMRGVALPEAVHIRSDSTLTIVLQPVRRVVGPLEARAAVVPVKDEVARKFDARIEVSADGIVRLRANATALFPDGPGEADVVIVVGRPGAVPDDVASLVRVSETTNRGLRVGRVHVDRTRDH
jgi:hypothetical protein